MAERSRTTAALMTGLRERGLDPSGLSPIGVRPRLGEYIAALWERRHFIWMDARHRVATQNSRNVLGRLWLVLRPLLDALMYFVIFAVILKVDRGMENFPGFIIIGILMFRSTMRAISQGPSQLHAGKAMIRAFSFPRASLPISAEIREAIQMIYTVAIMLVMIMIVPNHEQPEWTWFLVPVIYVLQFTLNLGLSLTFARIGFIFPDAAQFMSFVGRFLMYGSGVIFPLEKFVDRPALMFIIEMNPIYHMILMYREILMDGVIPSAEHWMILAAWAFGLLLFGFIFFWQGEETYGAEQR